MNDVIEPTEILKQIIKEYLEKDEEFDLIQIIPNAYKTNPFVDIVDKNNYKYRLKWAAFKSDRRNKRQLMKIYKNNPYLIENVNTYFNLERNGEYQCLSNFSEYKSTTTQLKFIHKKCGTIFNASIKTMMGIPQKKSISGLYIKECPKCRVNFNDSAHATALKQVFMKKHPDTTLEDRTCINPKTGFALPTDIVNHRLKIVIEIQSRFHDYEYKKETDSYKKQFWIEKGYKFYDPDIRDYTILELIQLFFPEIKEIPEYVDYKMGRAVDHNLVQKMLNDGMMLKEIAIALNKPQGTIDGLIHDKRCVLPEGYHDRANGIRDVVQLTPYGDFVKEYHGYKAIEKEGFKISPVAHVLRKHQDFSYGYYWLFKEDYEKGNYTIPYLKPDRYKVPVRRCKMDGTIVKEYKDFYEASIDSGYKRHLIYNVAIGKSQSHFNEKWEFIK